MRTLNDYFFEGGNMTAIQTAGNLSPIRVVPEAGVLAGVVINVNTVIGTITTFDVIVNTVESAVDVAMQTLIADETGEVMLPDGVLDLAEGDAIRIQSNGEQAAATTADICYIIRR